MVYGFILLVSAREIHLVEKLVYMWVTLKPPLMERLFSCRYRWFYPLRARDDASEHSKLLIVFTASLVREG